MAKRQRRNERRGCLGGLGYVENTPGCCARVKGCRPGELLVMNPPGLRMDKMSTGGHFKHVIIAFHCAGATKDYSRKCVLTNMHR